jgi:hypothetical protein
MFNEFVVYYRKVEVFGNVELKSLNTTPPLQRHASLCCSHMPTNNAVKQCRKDKTKPEQQSSTTSYFRFIPPATRRLVARWGRERQTEEQYSAKYEQ